MYRLAEEVGHALLAARLRVTTAESCTGGGLASALTDVPGSSSWFDRGYVTYSNEAKQHDLGVDPGALSRHGAVSAVVVSQMAAGALLASGADLALAISGVAGPDGGTSEKPVGRVYFALLRRGGRPEVSEENFPGDRAAVRRAAVVRALELLAAAAQAGLASRSNPAAPRVPPPA
jgi:nicotinamide-nucleotide amidase